LQLAPKSVAAGFVHRNPPGQLTKCKSFFSAYVLRELTQETRAVTN